MWGIVVRFVIGVLVSFYLFPVEFTFLLGQNTKKLLAVVGLAFLGFNYIKKRMLQVSRDFIIVSVFALLVSIAGVLSITYNNTPDTSYASYIVSMWVWLGGAYAVVSIIKLYHKEISIELLCYYLMGVCVAQCILALTIDLSPVVKAFVDRYFVTTLMDGIKRRLYGIGCGLDVAGTRFSAVLIMIAVVLMKHGQNMQKKRLFVMILSFIIIAVLGNMIARTTIVGLILSLLLICIKSASVEFVPRRQRVLRWMAAVIVLAIPLLSFYYDTNPQVRENIRFAFEGFFSLAEKGEWDVDSNNRLAEMVVFPDSFKTWIIGDGYFEGPTAIDPYYVGPTMTGFYMWTDIGYLRFIFYFGLLGLSLFLLFFAKCTQLCSTNMPEYKMLFRMLLLLNLLVWFKVSTDIFVVFALLLCVGGMQDETPQLEEEV